jgi:hypothetical protein
MLRQLARLRELQGRPAAADALRASAQAMADETMRLMYSADDSHGDGGRGWFNVVWPTGPNGTRPLVAHEMRHVVDFFSVTFGLCGTNTAPGGQGGALCDFDAPTRAQLGRAFREELKTSDWIRATSPQCDCSRSWPLPPAPPAPPASVSVDAASGDAAPASGDGEEYPAFETCSADREDHGTTGAYSAWPALAAEALCYVDGNCSYAFALLASFAPSARQGAFGQVGAAPDRVCLLLSKRLLLVRAPCCATPHLCLLRLLL